MSGTCGVIQRVVVLYSWKERQKRDAVFYNALRLMLFGHRLWYSDRLAELILVVYRHIGPSIVDEGGFRLFAFVPAAKFFDTAFEVS